MSTIFSELIIILEFWCDSSPRKYAPLSVTLSNIQGLPIIVGFDDTDLLNVNKEFVLKRLKDGKEYKIRRNEIKNTIVGK